MTCKHTGRVDITKYSVTAEIYRIFEGGHIYVDSEPGPMAQKIKVFCYDCKTRKEYYTSNIPKWVGLLLEKIDSSDGS